MKNLYQTLASLVLVGALVTGTGWSTASAQEGKASGDVEITDSADSPARPSAEKPARSNKMPKPKLTDRDPFKNAVRAGEFDTGSIVRHGTKGPTSLANTGTANTTDDVVYTDDVIEEVDPPAVTVSGIVSSGNGRRAILVSPDSSYIVSVGDKLSVFRVSAISATTVTFTYKEHNFEVKINDEFGLKS